MQFDAFANVQDAGDPASGNYKNRQVDMDQFHSRTIESRLLHDYNIGKIKSKLAAGVVYMNNNLHRQQLGKGITGSDYNLMLAEPGFRRDIHFLSNNIALFAENAFSITSKWTVSPGIRWKKGKSQMEGVIKYYSAHELPTTIKHQFALLGISTQYLLNKENTMYSRFYQAYRPVIFKAIVPDSVYERIDKRFKGCDRL